MKWHPGIDYIIQQQMQIEAVMPPLAHFHHLIDDVQSHGGQWLVHVPSRQLIQRLEL